MNFAWVMGSNFQNIAMAILFWILKGTCIPDHKGAANT